MFTFLGIGAVAQAMKKARVCFRSGHFIEANNEYSHIIEGQPQNLEALIYTGYTSLLQNKLNEAESRLMTAHRLKPGLTSINSFLADIHYRRNDFGKAAQYLRVIGRPGMALKLESFKGQKPYLIDEPFDMVSIAFTATNPLPFISVKINSKFEGNFILDTGGGELILDEGLAREAGIETFGKPEVSVFGAGKKANILHAKISSIQLDGFTVKNIPVQLLKLRHLTLEGLKIDGVIGTVFLSQFLSTIDYKNGLLVLRNKQTTTINQLSGMAVNPSIISFFLAGDHYMLAKGNINNSNTLVFFIDTGLAGTAFTCPSSTVKKMKLPVQKNKKSTGQGGGGNYDIYPFDIDRLCLGNVCVTDLHGRYGAFPPAIENAFGFKIDGLISHEFFLNKMLTLDFSTMQCMIND
jgi:hypothetical protein